MNQNKLFDDVLFFVTFIFTMYLLFTLTACQGRRGDVGAVGPMGVPGTSVQGPVGPSGASGADGTIIAVVQLCPGYVPTYPSVFPECALCIDGKLYALFYSPPSSGLTYLPDGTYSSTQTSAPCTFVVTGCTVQ
jgi:hypothetical protein